jgi:hypothetical protein
MKKKIVIAFQVIGTIGGIISWIWLFAKDWQMAVAIYFILFAMNVANGGGKR